MAGDRFTFKDMTKNDQVMRMAIPVVDLNVYFFIINQFSLVGIPLIEQ